MVAERAAKWTEGVLDGSRVLRPDGRTALGCPTQAPPSPAGLFSSLDWLAPIDPRSQGWDQIEAGKGGKTAATKLKLR